MTKNPFPIFPRLAAPTSVPAMMLDVIVALLPALGMSVYLFGTQVLWLTLCSVGFCLLFQWLFCLLFRRQKNFLDPSPWVTGLLLAFCYPADIPLWATGVGAFFAIVLVKELFGGLGYNFLNPALAGRMFLASAPFLMSHFPQPIPMVEANLIDALTQATPMASLQQGSLPSTALDELFLGFHSGSMGEVSTMMLLLGGCYLLLRRVISPTIPLTFLGTVALLCYCYPQGDALTWTLYQLCSGGLVLGAFFMATDPVTSPMTFRGQVLFGTGCGVLTLLLRYFGSYPEGVGFAILTMNGLVWLADRLGRPRYFAQEHFSLTKSLFRGVAKQWGQIGFVLPPLRQWKKLFTKEFWQTLWQTLYQKYFPQKQDQDEVANESFLARLPSHSKGLLSYLLVLALVLGAIILTDSLTSLEQHRREDAKIQRLLAQAMPDATFMSETPYQAENCQQIYIAYDQETMLGFCVEVHVAGFVDEIRLLVGIDHNGAITGIAVLSHKETLHVGEAMLQQEYLTEYIGKSGTVWTRAIDGMSSATKTRDAVTQGVNIALKGVQSLGQNDDTSWNHSS